MMMLSRALDLALPLVTVAILLILWKLSIHWFAVPAYLVPAPEDVLVALKNGLINGVLWPHIWATFQAIAIGYLVGCSAAFLAAAMMSESSILERACYPVVIGLQSIPKVALAPLLIVWFGFGLESKVVMVALMCFFPCFVNTITGLKAYDRNLADLYRAFGSKRIDIFFSVKLPSALGHIFSGLQVSVILAILGTVVCEIISSRRGLGNVIQASALNFDVGTMFACVIILSAMGIVATQIIRFAHRKLVFWEKTGSEQTV
jgi:NitT/TauT family transport system permease protein